MTTTGKRCKRGAVPLKSEGRIAKSPRSHKSATAVGIPVLKSQHSSACHANDLLHWIVAGGDGKSDNEAYHGAWPSDYYRSGHEGCMAEEEEARTRDLQLFDDDHQSAADTEPHDDAAAHPEAVKLPALDRSFIGMHEVMALGLPGLINYQRAQAALAAVLSVAPFNQFGMQVNVDDATLVERTDATATLVSQILTLESRSSVKKGQWVPRPCQYFSREQWKKLGIVPNHPHSGSPIALKITRFEREKVSVIGVIWNRVAGDAEAVLALLRAWSDHFDPEFRADAGEFMSRSEICVRESDLMVGEHFLNPDADDGFDSAASSPSSFASDEDADAFPLPLVAEEAVVETMDDDEGDPNVTFVEYRVSAEGVRQWKEDNGLSHVADDVAVTGACLAGILGGEDKDDVCDLKVMTQVNIRGRCSQVSGNLIGNALAFHGMDVKNGVGELEADDMRRTVHAYHDSVDEFVGGGDVLFDHTMGRLARKMSRGEDEGLRLWPSFMQMAADRSRVLVESWCGVEVFETQPSGWGFGTGKEVSHMGWPDYGCPRAIRVMPNFRSGKDMAVLVGLSQREVDRLDKFVTRHELPMKLIKQ